MPARTLDSVLSLARRRGFFFPSGEIYGGMRSAWDYGPLGVALKENLRRQWWLDTVQRRDDVVGMDTAILLPRAARPEPPAGKVAAERTTRCQSCHTAYRLGDLLGPGVPEEALADVACPTCGARSPWTPPAGDQMLLSTVVGTGDAETDVRYLRPATSHGILLNLAAVMSAARRRPPFGIAQSGKTFRNEVTPGDGPLRTREFEQMELDFFVAPGEGPAWLERWTATRLDWYTRLGIGRERLRLTERPEEQVAPGQRVLDLQYRFEDGQDRWDDLECLAFRGDHDLLAHAERSGRSFEYADPVTGARYVPHVVGCAAGLSRAVLMFLLEAYDVDRARNAKGGEDERVVLRLDPRLAPVKVAVLPLSRNEELSPRAREIAAGLRERWMVDVDDAGGIGRRYRRQDEVGTPLCVTVDFTTADDGAVTVRERDTMAQVRVPLAGLEAYLGERLRGC